MITFTLIRKNHKNLRSESLTFRGARNLILMHSHSPFRITGKNGLRLLLCLIQVLFYSNVKAQIPGMRKFTQVDGYTATKGYEIEQDETGNILLGTDNGGMIFDGKKFRVAMDTRQSPDAEILYVRPIEDSRMLLLPLSNTASYLYKGKLYTAAEDKRLRGGSMGLNHCRLDPVTGAWWVSNSNISTLYRFYKGDIRKYETGKDNFTFFSIVNDNFVGSYPVFQGRRIMNRSAYYNINTSIFQQLYFESGEIAELSKEHIMIYTGPLPNYISYYNLLKKQINIYKLSLPDSVLQWIKAVNIPGTKETPHATIDRNHNLWVKLYDKRGGIGYYGNVSEHGVAQKEYRFTDPFIVNSIFVDRNNNIWLSTPNNALYFLSEKHFANVLLTARFPRQKETPQAISGDGHGRLCISYINNPALLCIKGDKYKTVAPVHRFREGSRHILPVNDTEFLVYHDALALLNIKTHTLTPIRLPSILIKDCCLYGAESLLAATVEGVHYRDHFKEKNALHELIFNKRSTTVDVLKDKRIVIGTPVGLYIKKSLHTPAVVIDHPILSVSNIVDVQALYDGGFLVGTNSQGLFLVDRTGNRVRPVLVKNNNGSIRRIYRQDDSTYWLATDEGAYSMVFNRNWVLSSSRNFTFYDGLPSNNVTDVYVAKDTAYFTTMHGLGIIPLTDSTRLQMAPPGICISAVQSDDSVFYKPDSVISLPYGQNNILVSLSAISYESLGNTGYYYQLYPLHDTWIETTSPEVRFTGLPPGKYTFRAYATNAKGIKSRKPVVLRIEIKPAFWQTIYFKIALLIVAGILLYMLTRWNIQRRERAKYAALQQKKRLAELELEAIKAQINPHFIYNCLNSIKYLNYMNEYKQTQVYLSIFARLIRMTLQYSRRTFINIAEEADYLSNYLQLEKLRFKDKLNYTIDIQEEVNRDMMIPAMLLQPYVENALKHGIAGKEDGRVEVAFQKKGGDIYILIRDNGPGFSHVKKDNALGMQLSGARASSYNELFDLDIKVECYNEQDNGLNKTGAIVKITIQTLNDGNTIHQSNYH